ncbi:MAG: hypothetical protein SGCHY_004172, partial [Lobulomycetales sp.]
VVCLLDQDARNAMGLAARSYSQKEISRRNKTVREPFCSQVLDIILASNATEISQSTNKTLLPL